MPCPAMKALLYGHQPDIDYKPKKYLHPVVLKALVVLKAAVQARKVLQAHSVHSVLQVVLGLSNNSLCFLGVIFKL